MASVAKCIRWSRPPYMTSLSSTATMLCPQRGVGRVPPALSSSGSHMSDVASSEKKPLLDSSPVQPPKKNAWRWRGTHTRVRWGEQRGARAWKRARWEWVCRNGRGGRWRRAVKWRKGRNVVHTRTHLVADARGRAEGELAGRDAANRAVGPCGQLEVEAPQLIRRHAIRLWRLLLALDLATVDEEAVAREARRATAARRGRLARHLGHLPAHLLEVHREERVVEGDGVLARLDRLRPAAKHDQRAAVCAHLSSRAHTEHTHNAR